MIDQTELKIAQQFDKVPITGFASMDASVRSLLPTVF
jgi:hypothetical protein